MEEMEISDIPTASQQFCCIRIIQNAKWLHANKGEKGDTKNAFVIDTLHYIKQLEPISLVSLVNILMAEGIDLAALLSEEEMNKIV